MLNVKDIVMTDRMMLNSSLQPSHPGYDHAYDGGMIKKTGLLWLCYLSTQPELLQQSSNQASEYEINRNLFILFMLDSVSQLPIVHC